MDISNVNTLKGFLYDRERDITYNVVKGSVYLHTRNRREEKVMRFVILQIITNIVLQAQDSGRCRLKFPNPCFQ